jgi:hypothetical protein
MNVVLIQFLNWILDGLDWATDHMPLWATYLILLALSMAAWYGVVQVCVSIADAMTLYRLKT